MTGFVTQIKFSEVQFRVKETTEKMNKLKKEFDQEDNAQEIIRSISKEVDEFRLLVPLIRELTKEAIVKNPDYWNEIFSEIGTPTPKQSTA